MKIWAALVPARSDHSPRCGNVVCSPNIALSFAQRRVPIAAAHVEYGTPLATDAAVYLGRYGSPAMKPVVWDQLSKWHNKYAESGTDQRISSGAPSQDDWTHYNLESKLLEAYETAQAWTLSPEDVHNLSTLIGDKRAAGLACTFSCGSLISVGPTPGNYTIYGRINDPVFPSENRIDYLMPVEPFRYSINQYRCPDLESLEQKLLQFPAGSTFHFANTGSGLDEGDWASISEFLRSHGYVARN